MEIKIIALFKSIIVLIIFLAPVFSIAQNELIVTEKLPVDAEKIEILFRNQAPVYLFNKIKSKANLGSYGAAKIEKESPSEGTTRIMGVTYSETKFKYSIELTTSENVSSKFSGKQQLLKINAIGNLTVVEDESSVYPKTIKASITTTLENSKSWDFILKMNDLNALLSIEIGSLTQGERTIHVTQINMDGVNENGSAAARRLAYEFIEDGISLGAVTFSGENIIWLKPDLDSTTKLVLCTAMLSIAY